MVISKNEDEKYVGASIRCKLQAVFIERAVRVSLISDMRKD